MAQLRISAEILALPEKKILAALATDLSQHYQTEQAVLLVSGALAIKAGGGVLVKAVNATYACALNAAGQVVLLTKVANTDMAALAGTVTNAKFNVFCFFQDSAGTLTTLMGVEAATIGAVVFPTFPTNKAWMGMIIVNPTGAGNFVGGTTPLDDVGVIPNVVYVNGISSFNPSLLASVVA